MANPVLFWVVQILLFGPLYIFRWSSRKILIFPSGLNRTYLHRGCICGSRFAL